MNEWNFEEFCLTIPFLNMIKSNNYYRLSLQFTYLQSFANQIFDIFSLLKNNNFDYLSNNNNNNETSNKTMLFQTCALKSFYKKPTDT